MNIGGRIDENGVRTEEKRASEVLPGEKFRKKKRGEYSRNILFGSAQLVAQALSSARLSDSVSQLGSDSILRLRLDCRWAWRLGSARLMWAHSSAAEREGV
jgi:hypothetical protein